MDGGDLVPGKPTAIAMLLALVSLPLVVLTFDAVDITYGGLSYRGTVAPESEAVQWTAAASAVFSSAFVAGTLGAGAVRKDWRHGALSTFTLALLVAIAALPVVPALLGQHVGAGCFYFGGGAACGYGVTSDNLASGLWADVFVVVAPLIEPVPLVILALGVGIWTYLVRCLPERADSKARERGARRATKGSRG